MTLKSIFITCCVIAVAWYWLKNRSYKEYALRRAAEHCHSLGLTFLDQSVLLERFRLKRHLNNKLMLVREYSFEFSSTGEKRYKGRIVLAGFEILDIALETHKLE